MMKWAKAVHWIVFVSLTVCALLNAATDHGVAMAINCICLGFMLFSLLMRKMLDKRLAEAEALLTRLKVAEAGATAAAAAMGQAINDGRIEVVPLAPDQLPTRPTRH